MLDELELDGFGVSPDDLSEMPDRLGPLPGHPAKCCVVFCSCAAANPNPNPNPDTNTDTDPTKLCSYNLPVNSRNHSADTEECQVAALCITIMPTHL